VGLSISLVAQVAADEPWNPNAVYAAREAQLKHAIEANPRAAQPLVDLAAFYLKPLLDTGARSCHTPFLGESTLSLHRSLDKGGHGRRSAHRGMRPMPDSDRFGERNRRVQCRLVAGRAAPVALKGPLTTVREVPAMTMRRTALDAYFACL